MKTYTYEFATESTEIEISEEWMKVLEDLDRELYNNNQTETRRHTSYSYGDDAEWLASDETEDLFDHIEAGQLLDLARQTLTDKQFHVFLAISVNGHTYTSCAKEMGIAIKNVRALYLKAISNLRKTLKISD